MRSFFGLDIGTFEVKVLEATKSNEGFIVDKIGAAKVGQKDVSEAIKSAIKEAGIKTTSEVNVALPESDVFTRIIETPKLSEAELASSIEYEAEQYVPLSLSEVELFHQVLPETDEIKDKTMKVLLIAVPKTRINQLLELIDKVGLIPKSLETELFSLKRVFSDESKVQILLSCGDKTTDLMIVKRGVFVFTHSANVGGLALTKSLVNELSLSFEQAEEYKRTYGMREDLLEGKVAKVLMPTIDEVINQINKALLYLNQQGYTKTPDQLIITGGGALLPGLSTYLATKLNMEVVVGDPFSRFKKDEEFKKKIVNETNPQLATVTGLALKGWLEDGS